MIAGPSERHFPEILAHTSLCILCVYASHVDRWEGLPRSFRQKNVGMLAPDADPDMGTSLFIDERSGTKTKVRLQVFNHNMYVEGTGV
jgi:hypothetical protein